MGARCSARSAAAPTATRAATTASLRTAPAAGLGRGSREAHTARATTATAGHPGPRPVDEATTASPAADPSASGQRASAHRPTGTRTAPPQRASRSQWLWVARSPARLRQTANRASDASRSRARREEQGDRACCRRRRRIGQRGRRMPGTTHRLGQAGAAAEHADHTRGGEGGPDRHHDHRHPGPVQRAEGADDQECRQERDERCAEREEGGRAVGRSRPNQPPDGESTDHDRHRESAPVAVPDEADRHQDHGEEDQTEGVRWIEAALEEHRAGKQPEHGGGGCDRAGRGLRRRLRRAGIRHRPHRPRLGACHVRRHGRPPASFSQPARGSSVPGRSRPVW